MHYEKETFLLFLHQIAIIFRLKHNSAVIIDPVILRLWAESTCLFYQRGKSTELRNLRNTVWDSASFIYFFSSGVDHMNDAELQTLLSSTE